MGDCCVFPWVYVSGDRWLVGPIADCGEVFRVLKRVRLEVEMLLPTEADLNSALLLAGLTEALEGLVKQARIEWLKYDPG
jgi:hypothetical protein